MKRVVLNEAFTGHVVHLNPMQMIGWVAADHPLDPEGRRIMAGSVVALVDGPRRVRQTPEQIDFLFEQATEGWMRPPITRQDLQAFVDKVRAETPQPDAVDAAAGRAEP